jgi:O-antigen ligase
MNKTLQTRFVTLSVWIWLGLLAYMPLHILLSTWVGSSFDILPLTKAAKDVVLLVGFLLALLANLVSKNKAWKHIFRDRLVQLIVAYGLLNLILVLIRPTDADSELLGLVYNTRFFIMFLYGLLLMQLTNAQKLRKQTVITVMGVALPVLIFGIVQYIVLPDSALTHVGYSRANGVLPAFFIDDKPDLERVMSTIRDPNSFGSYLIIIGALSLGLLSKKPKPKKLFTFYFLLSIVCLWFTFSRSAWLGFGLMVIAYVWLQHKQQISALLRRYKVQVAIFAMLLIPAVYLALTSTALQNSYFVQNVVFHADQSTTLEDPNELRIRFWQESVSGILQEPLGSGPGTAGLASIRNNVQGTELNENYYLQVGSEVGLLGLLLFMAILALTGLRLYRQASTGDVLARVLLASFFGLALTNFLVHIWSNEAVALTWWALAGVAIPSGLLKSKKAA